MKPRTGAAEQGLPSFHRRAAISKFRSFTLLELLVAISVLSIMMMILFQIFNESTRAWAAAERKVDAFREARAALHIMARDLRSAVVTNGAAMAINENFLDAQPDYMNASLFFVTAQPAEAQDGSDHSDLCAVGYYAAYGGDQSQIGVTNSFKIRRWFQGSNQTFTNLVGYLGLFDLKKLFYPPPNVGLSGDEVLARNIGNLHFSWVTNQTGPLRDSGIALTTPPPLQVEISFDALNYDTAKKLQTKGDWLATNQPLYQANIQHFSARVTVGGAR